MSKTQNQKLYDGISKRSNEHLAFEKAKDIAFQIWGIVENAYNNPNIRSIKIEVINEDIVVEPCPVDIMDKTIFPIMEPEILRLVSTIANLSDMDAKLYNQPLKLLFKFRR